MAAFMTDRQSKNRVMQTGHPVFENFRKQNAIVDTVLSSVKVTVEPVVKVEILLSALLHLGDNDEVANKHIGYTLYAIKMGGALSVTDDYSSVGTPSPDYTYEGYDKNDHNWLSEEYDRIMSLPATRNTQKRKLTKIWKLLLPLISELGMDKIAEIDQKISWGYYESVCDFQDETPYKFG
jgi:hypothetical protein